jgi:hypothetical protein
MTITLRGSFESVTIDTLAHPKKIVENKIRYFLKIDV